MLLLQAGVYIFLLIDWYSSIFVVFLISLLECIVVSYLYGKNFTNNVNKIYKQ